VIKMKNKLITSKKALEFQYVVAIIILLAFLIFVLIWIIGLGNSAGSILDSLFK